MGRRPLPGRAHPPTVKHFLQEQRGLPIRNMLELQEFQKTFPEKREMLSTFAAPLNTRCDPSDYAIPLHNQKSFPCVRRIRRHLATTRNHNGNVSSADGRKRLPNRIATAAFDLVCGLLGMVSALAVSKAAFYRRPERNPSGMEET